MLSSELPEGHFRCYKCGDVKVLTEKCRNKMCKKCFSDYKKERYRTNPEPVKKKIAEYRASHKAALYAADKVWRQNNREKIAARFTRWRKANPVKRLLSQAKRRARKRGSQVVPITPAMLEARLAVFGGRCSYCGGPFEHWDHLKPLELGGPHILSNLRPSCAACNVRKGTAPAKEWMSGTF